MLILNEKDIERLCDPVELTSTMESAMQCYAKGNFVMPDRMHVDFGKNTLLLMPASSDDFFATKLVTMFPDNPKRNEPVLYGTVVLCDGASGKPLAIFNGAKLTAVRTAAVGSCGVKHLSPEDADTLGLVGAGVQGYHQVLFACNNRPIKQVRIFDPWVKDLSETAKRMHQALPQVEIHIADTIEELCEQSRIIITATNATEAVLPNIKSYLERKCIVAIGSYKSEMVEIPDVLFSLIKQCFIDVDMAIEESGDLIHPLAKNLVHPAQIKLLSDILSNQLVVDTSDTQLYKSVGMALFDLYAAKYLYKKAIRSGTGQHVDF